MPVERYRSGEEMNATSPRRGPAAADGFERFLRLCRRYRSIAPRRYPPGVFRFRSVEEAQAARERIAREDRDSPS